MGINVAFHFILFADISPVRQSAKHFDRINILGEKIRTLRESEGISKQHLANEAEIDRRTLERIETGQVAANIDTLLSIAEALNISIVNLVQDI